MADPQQTADKEKLVLVDAFSHIYRSFHAIPRLTNDEGNPTNCIYGVASFLLRIDEILPHTYAAVAFDKGAPAARMELLPEYKATRPEMPEDMKQQLDGIRTWVEAAGWPVLEQEGREADDLIAGVVHKRQAEETYIVSGDKDLCQLVAEDVWLMIPGRKGELKEVGVQEVEEKWGIPPRSICDYLAIVGDSSDNINGVPGVGPKTAVQLLRQFGSIDQMLARIDEVEGQKLRNKLVDHKDILDRNRELIRLDVALPEDCEDVTSLCRRRPDWKTLRELAEYYNFKSLMKRIDKLKESVENPTLL